MDRTEPLLSFIRDHLASDPASVKDAQQSLIRTGIIDSFALVELGLFIEEEFGVHVPDPELTVANFDTVQLAVKTIDKHGAR
jgi:acyl carrier protein